MMHYSSRNKERLTREDARDLDMDWVEEWDALGLSSSEAFALVWDVTDASTFISYYETSRLASEAADLLQDGRGRPILVIKRKAQ